MAIRLEMGAPKTFARENQTPAGSGHLQATLEALRTAMNSNGRARAAAACSGTSRSASAA